jgi:hypothetical protein
LAYEPAEAVPAIAITALARRSLSQMEESDISLWAPIRIMKVMELSI